MTVARILAGLGVLFALLSLLAGYIRFQGLDTETVKEPQRSSSPTTRSAIRSRRRFDALYANMDVAGSAGAEAARRSRRDSRSCCGGTAPRSFDRAGQPGCSALRGLQALERATPRRGRGQLIKVLDDDSRDVQQRDGAVGARRRAARDPVGGNRWRSSATSPRSRPDAGRVEIMQADQLDTAGGPDAGSEVPGL